MRAGARRFQHGRQRVKFERLELESLRAQVAIGIVTRVSTDDDGFMSEVDPYPERNFGLNPNEMEPHVFEQMLWESRYAILDRPPPLPGEDLIGQVPAPLPDPSSEEAPLRQRDDPYSRAMALNDTFIEKMRAAGHPGARKYWGWQHGLDWIPGRSAGRAWYLCTRGHYEVAIDTQGGLFCLSRGLMGRWYLAQETPWVRSDPWEDGLKIDVKVDPPVIPWAEFARLLSSTASANGVHL
jgi:hypothetical protein